MEKIETSRITSAAWPENASESFRRRRQERHEWALLAAKKAKAKFWFALTVIAAFVTLLFFIIFVFFDTPVARDRAVLAAGVTFCFLLQAAYAWSCVRCKAMLGTFSAKFCPDCRMPLNEEAAHWPLFFRPPPKKKRRREETRLYGWQLIRKRIIRTLRWAAFVIWLGLALIFHRGERANWSRDFGLSTFLVVIFSMASLCVIWFFDFVIESVLVTADRQCPSCGKHQLRSSKYCHSCSNLLE